MGLIAVMRRCAATCQPYAALAHAILRRPAPAFGRATCRALIHQREPLPRGSRPQVCVHRRRLDHGQRRSRRSRGTVAVPKPVSVYAAEIRRWAGRGGLVAAAAQDYMCEPYMLAKTGLTIADHQRLTVERYDALVTCDVGGVYIMPVLQGCKRSATFCGRPTAWLGRSLPESRAGVRMTGKRRRNSSGPSPRRWRK